MLDTETISRLLETADPAISIYLPLEPEQRDQRAPDTRLRELIGEAEKMMTRDGIELRRREQLLAPLQQIANDTDFAEHRDPALAIFATDGFNRVEPLPGHVSTFVSVAPNFHVKPLLPFLAANQHFFILALSKAKARLLAATPFSCAEVPLGYLPPDAQAQLDSEAENRTAEAPPGSGTERQALITESPKRIAAAVKAAIGTDPAPIVLVGDPQTTGHFTKQADMRGLLPEVLAFNPFAIPDSELLDKALTPVRPLLSSELETALDQANARLGTAEPTVSLRLEEILHAAREGRVDTLMVADDDVLWGHFSPDHIVAAHGRRSPHDEDLLNQAVVFTLRTGGHAFALPRERLPRQVESCALLRF